MTPDKRQAIEFAQALRQWATPCTSDYEEATAYLQKNAIACGYVVEGKPGVCVKITGHKGKCKRIQPRPL